MAARDHRELSGDEDSVVAAGDLRRGPWTVEEDMLLVNYVAAHGEGRWNALARCAGTRCCMLVATLRDDDQTNNTMNCACRAPADGEELPPAVAQLPAAGPAAGQHHGAGAAAHP
jgi:hypothetical protein